MNTPKCSARQPRLAGQASSLLIELRNPSLLIRHISLCRLLHATEPGQLTADDLDWLGSQLLGEKECVATAEVVAYLSRLRRAMRTKSPEVPVLRAAATACVAAHGYRISSGPAGR